ncbi:hypothetical protein ACHQM5_017095 [Ranunculus cassubicifolius]
MASLLCRSVARCSVALSRPKSLTSKSMPSLIPPTTRSTSRIAMALGCMESLMPLHSAIASARLKSIIAADTSCWSFLSQDFAVPR